MKFHVLPYAGGLFAQPSGHILRLEQVLRAYDAYEQAQIAKTEARQKLNSRVP